MVGAVKPIRLRPPHQRETAGGLASSASVEQAGARAGEREVSSSVGRRSLVRLAQHARRCRDRSCVACARALIRVSRRRKQSVSEAASHTHKLSAKQTHADRRRMDEVAGDAAAKTALKGGCGFKSSWKFGAWFQKTDSGRGLLAGAVLLHVCVPVVGEAGRAAGR